MVNTTLYKISTTKLLKKVNNNTCILSTILLAKCQGHKYQKIIVLKKKKTLFEIVKNYKLQANWQHEVYLQTANSTTFCKLSANHDL